MVTRPVTSVFYTKGNLYMQKRKCKVLNFNPIAATIILSLPVAAHADIVMKNGSAAMANGVPVININGANANGISHNVYDRLNVGKEGLVFNNSKDGVTSQLAGQIAGNSNLSAGAAKVILNEVTSNNRSTLNGMMEVAGDKAQLIIANPNGITCDSCGFINADKATLTTGTPDMKNGQLQGYSVNGGTIAINNKMASDSPTSILARSVAVAGELRASGQDLTIVTGNNYVNTSDQVTGSVTARGGRNAYSLDVARLGGMYAGKITLVSTESGVGVRNQGIISAGKDILLDAKGNLLNTNATLQATGNIGINLTNGINNVTGKILSAKSISIDTNRNSIDNSLAGNIMATGDIGISSGNFNNRNGKLAASGTLGINTNNNTLTNYGQGNTVGIEAGVVLLQTGQLNNENGQIKGYYVGTQSASVNNSNAIIDSVGDVVMLSNGDVNNRGGLIRSGSGKVQIDATRGRLTNSSTRTADLDSEDSKGIVAGDGGIQIATNYLANNGQIQSSGDIGIQSNSHISNRSGKIMSVKSVAIKSNTLDTGTGSITTEEGGIRLETTGALQNNIGWISSRDDYVHIQAQRIDNGGIITAGSDINLISGSNVDNSYGLISADRNVTVQAKNNLQNNNGLQFGSVNGRYLGMVGQKGGIIGRDSVEISAQNVYSENSRIIANSGTLKLNSDNRINNRNGQLVGRGGLSLVGKQLSNNYGTVYTANNADINVESLDLAASGTVINNNAKGLIVADNDLNLNVKNSFRNYGWITGGNSANVTSDNIIYNYNTIHSKNAVTVGASSVYNYKDLVGEKSLNATARNTIYNSGNLFSYGLADIKANRLENTAAGLLGGREGTQIEASSQTNRGRIVGL
ncbi:MULTISPECIES: two-partner secretion domain-containing protein [Tenebrionibacter/Tenebrionicola group]|jgi:filamentous hemagglutinin family protein|nr:MULTISPECIES: filamentous hemagglutinin N-terminal domain-containing protein [Tenebrionibacter/Tenebrionicola group]